MVAADAIPLSLLSPIPGVVSLPHSVPLSNFTTLCPSGGWTEDGRGRTELRPDEAAKFQRSNRKFHVDCTVPAVL